MKEGGLRCFSFAILPRVYPWPIKGHEGHESRTNLPLGNDNHLSAFALNPCFGTGVQLVGAFSRDENITETCYRSLVEVPFLFSLAPAPSLPTERGLNPKTESRGRKTTDERDCRHQLLQPPAPCDQLSRNEFPRNGHTKAHSVRGLPILRARIDFPGTRQPAGAKLPVLVIASAAEVVAATAATTATAGTGEISARGARFIHGQRPAIERLPVKPAIAR